MIIGKFKIEDLNKLVKVMALSRSPSTFTVTADGPSMAISYVGDDGKLVKIQLFDESVSAMPTITKTDYL